ncbi:MAG: polysaccharide biosynthesis tyrosine autokinase [Actinobacteria bacterium]|nr:polysaccharide biosynthesis tyrosine autokinase [Actinomycetota bacterium]
MTIDQILSVLWRRRLSFLLAFLVCLGAVTAVTFTLPKGYTATATLYVGGALGEGEFIDTSLLEQHTRTYSTLAGNPNIADLVRRRLEDDPTREELLERMTFAPVERTQLLQITSEGGSPEEARAYANTYAETFVERMTVLFGQGKTPAEIAISEPAATPRDPSKPNPPLYLGFGGVLALFLALGTALLRESLDTRVRVAPSDQSLFDQPIVGRVPQFDSKSSKSRQVADHFALLKTNLDFFDADPARVVLITSPGIGEGKSTVAANLALAAANDGERVVLIEADLRRPGLDSTRIAEGLKRSQVGLSNYLAGAAIEAEICARHPEHPLLTVIWAGVIAPNPTALLGSNRLDTLLADLRIDCERIIIDTSPVSVGADASVIASRVDGVLYIVDERKTKRAEALAGLNQLRSVRARLLGVVLNRAEMLGGEGDYYGDAEASARKRRRLRRSEPRTEAVS